MHGSDFDFILWHALKTNGESTMNFDNKILIKSFEDVIQNKLLVVLDALKIGKSSS